MLRDVSGDDSPRIPLFFALVESHDYSLAISDAEPMIRTGLLPYDQSESDDEDAPMTPPIDGFSWMLHRPEACNALDELNPTGSGACAETQMPAISIREKEQLAEKLSDSHKHLGDLPLATNYLRIAIQLETDAKHRASLREFSAQLRAESARRSADGRAGQ